MHSTNLDVPALVPSALGHRPQLSISSSSSGWSAVVTDEEEGDPYAYAASDYNSEMISLDLPSSKPSSHIQSGLSYTRRPSATNHRATVPLLHRNHSSATSSSASSVAGIPHSLPSPFYVEDDASSLCPSEDPNEDCERESTLSVAVSQRKRNRVSLPAYFSLLQGSTASPSSSPRLPKRVPSALQALSRSLHASPTTPKVAHAAVFPTLADTKRDDETLASSPRGRGRRRERDPDARSASSRRDIARSPPRHASRATLTASERARIDSVEKVAEWVSSSPVISPFQHARTKYAVRLPEAHPQRRNSSPRPTKPRYEFAEALAMSLRGCAIVDDDDEEEDVERRRRAQEERRGRRRVDELDEPQRGEAPGIGNGRSGLRARERGRAGAVRALAQH
ncbi:hypothetical protein EIP86_004372 [Pleurotus ostreatoroseus]|nr:hypothetical protein EIP86_004372 [Pleurotus ostreatoroseus]